MEQRKTAGGEAQETRQAQSNLVDMNLDAQFAELIEAVWACERNWDLDDRVQAAIRYGR